MALPEFAAATHSTRWLEDAVDPAILTGALPTGTGVPAPDAADDLQARTVPVEVNGKRFAVTVWMPEAPAGAAAPSGKAPKKRAAAAGGASGGGDGTVTAPMQGTIVKVLVEAGQTVEIGEAVVVLEAMKMENHINAAKAGTVTEVRVAAGDAVGNGDVLVVVE
jgi:acetyl-CoA/propionyl-CoA carboxylase biotin carboxyl carrier protein